MKQIIDFDDDDILVLNEIEYPVSLIAKILNEIDLADYELFRCSICGEFKEIGEKCNEHAHIDYVCKDCCEWCKLEAELNETE